MIIIKQGNGITIRASGQRGLPGQGVPTGGTTGEVLAKTSNANYDTEWVAQSGGVAVQEVVAGDNVIVDNTDPERPIVSSTSGGDVESVNGATGEVELDEDDIPEGVTNKKFTETDRLKLATIAPGATVNSPDATLLNRANHTGTQAISTVDSLQAKLDSKISENEKGSNNGVAELDGTGKIPSSQLPSSVDQIIEVADFASLPVTGEESKIYVTIDEDKTYRWGGTQYVEISASLALGETSATAYRGDRGKTAYDHSQLTSGNPHNVTKTDVGLSNVDNTSDATKNAASATLTNKTLTSPVVNTAISGTAIDTDGTLVANSDTKLASQKATKTYVDAAATYVADRAISEPGAIRVRDPGITNWYNDINDASAIPVDMVMLGDSISVLIDWPAQVANQLYNRFNTRTGLTNSVIGQSGYLSAGGTYGVMNGTLQGTAAAEGAHIGPGFASASTAANGLYGTTTSNNATTPDAAALDITSDISMVSKLQPGSWIPGSGTTKTIVAKWQASGQFAYRLQITTLGILRLVWSTTGSNSVTANSTVAVPFTNEEAYVGVSLDVNNGASGYDVKFYTSPDGAVWTQLGTTVVGGSTTSIFSGTSKLEIGSSLDGTAEFGNAKIERTQIYSGLRDFSTNTGGTLVFDANFEAQSFGTTSFSESSSNAATVTVNFTAGTTAYINTLAGSGRELAISNSVSSTNACSGVYVVFRGGGGTLTVKDGGSGGTTKATIDTSLYSGNNNLYWVNLTTYASHDIYIECSVGATIIDGICTTAGNNTAGILLWRVGLPGAASTFYINYPGHGTNLVTRIKALRSREPHVFVQTGYNDGSTTVYQTAINRLIDDIQTRTSGSIALMAPWQRGVGLEKSYIARTVASSQGTGLIDAGRVIGDVSAYADIANLSQDNIHPNENGGLALAMMVYAVLSGDPIGSTMDILWANNKNYGNMLATSFSIGSYSIATVFGIPIINSKNLSTDVGVEFGQYGSGLANVFYAYEKHLTMWGDTVTALDVSMARHRATELTLNMGASAITNRMSINGVAKVVTTPVGNIGTGEDNLMTWTAPASSLSGDGQSYRVEAAGTIASNANTKTLKFYFGATSVSFTLPTSVAATWVLRANVIRTGAATQVLSATVQCGTTSIAPTSASPTETLSSTSVIKCTGEATSSNDIVQTMMKVYWEPNGA